MKDFYSNSPRTGLSQLSPSIPGSRVIVDPHAPAELEPTCANKIRVDNHDHRGGTVLFIQRPEFYWRSADRSGACPEPGTFLKILVAVVTSPWLPLGLFLFGVIVLLYIYVPSLIKAPRTPKEPQPLFALECGPEVPGSERPALWANGPEGLPVKFLRVVVHVAGKESIANCTGYLTEIRKTDQKKWEGDNAKLTFAPGEDPDALSKTIHERMPEFLDVLIVTSRNEIFAGTKGRGWPYIPPLHEIFSEAGEYLLSVSITGPGIATAAPQLRFTWTRNWETSRLRF